ncbi:hypothetical protein AVEN_159756-1 [Araneus ventricosus]|uniref:Uncharacterized protein n=1 Tax=Araneus ventricosus TaxID=182803 RepID=A0A4Y2S476_ARAVE|nr:hypothetical protein AVEN_159756-1 [Araneus ventricosus]
MVFFFCQSSDDDGIDENTWSFFDKDLCGELEESSKDVERFFSDINNDKKGIIIHKKKSRFCKKYQGEQLIFEAMANPAGFAFSVWDDLLINLIDTLRRLIEEILQRSTEGLSLQDLIRICVFAPGLDYPISTCA